MLAMPRLTTNACASRATSAATPQLASEARPTASASLLHRSRRVGCGSVFAGSFSIPKRERSSVGEVAGDALVAGLKAEWSEAKVNRERAERRLGELEGIERDLAADRTEVEQLRTTWASWSAVLQAAIDAPTGSIPAETQHQARQIL